MRRIRILSTIERVKDWTLWLVYLACGAALTLYMTGDCVRDAFFLN